MGYRSAVGGTFEIHPAFLRKYRLTIDKLRAVYAENMANADIPNYQHIPEFVTWYGGVSMYSDGILNSLYTDGEFSFEDEGYSKHYHLDEMMYFLYPFLKDCEITRMGEEHESTQYQVCDGLLYVAGGYYDPPSVSDNDSDSDKDDYSIGSTDSNYWFHTSPELWLPVHHPEQKYGKNEKEAQEDEGEKEQRGFAAMAAVINVEKNAKKGSERGSASILEKDRWIYIYDPFLEWAYGAEVDKKLGSELDLLPLIFDKGKLPREETFRAWLSNEMLGYITSSIRIDLSVVSISHIRTYLDGIHAVNSAGNRKDGGIAALIAASNDKSDKNNKESATSAITTYTSKIDLNGLSESDQEVVKSKIERVEDGFVDLFTPSRSGHCHCSPYLREVLYEEYIEGLLLAVEVKEDGSKQYVVSTLQGNYMGVKPEWNMRAFDFEDDCRKIRSKRLYVDNKLRKTQVLAVMPYDCSFSDFFELLLLYCYYDGVMINRQNEMVRELDSNATSEADPKEIEEERDLESVMDEIEQLMTSP